MEGTVRAANMTIAPTEPSRRTFDSMYWYDPMQVELGAAPLRGFSRLQETDSPFLARSDRWNRLMIDAAFVQEDLSRARRLLLYAGEEPATLSPHVAAVEAILEELDSLQQTYGRLYDAGAADKLPDEFDPAADRLRGQLAQAGQKLHALFEQLAADRAHPVQWRPVDRSEPWWNPETRRHRYLLWSRWSSPAFWEREAPLDMGPGATLTAGTPKSFVDGRADWSNYMDQWAVKGGDKASQSSLITHYALHDKGYLAPEFAARHENDPELTGTLRRHRRPEPPLNVSNCAPNAAIGGSDTARNPERLPADPSHRSEVCAHRSGSHRARPESWLRVRRSRQAKGRWREWHGAIRHSMCSRFGRPCASGREP